MKPRFFFLAIGCALLPLTPNLHAASAGAITGELKTRAERSLSQGAAFLIGIQQEDGSVGRTGHPAISALAALALHGSPAADTAARDAARDRAMGHVLKYVQDDGAIFPKAEHEANPTSSGYYPNYTTSIALLAMAIINKPEYEPLMRRARAYLQSNQFQDPTKVDFGGIGYGKTGRADLSNGSWSATALYYTDYLDREPLAKDPAAGERMRKMWADLATFVGKCQNLPEQNDADYVSKDPEDLGGFVYRPFESKAGERASGAAQPGLISSGSMTYAGLMTMIYCRLGKDDVRVRGALDYLRRNYTVDENPGMGMQGYYYYLHVMTKALQAYNADAIVDAAGQSHDWREDIVERLVSQQAENGAWTNEDGRFMESLPELVTAYNMSTLKMVTGLLQLAE